MYSHVRACARTRTHTRASVVYTLVNAKVLTSTAPATCACVHACVRACVHVRAHARVGEVGIVALYWVFFTAILGLFHSYNRSLLLLVGIACAARVGAHGNGSARKAVQDLA